MTYVLLVLKGLCKGGEVNGTLRDSSSTAAGATYVPSVYLKLQRESFDLLFASQGFITIEQAFQFGVAASSLGEFAVQSFVSPMAFLPST